MQQIKQKLHKRKILVAIGLVCCIVLAGIIWHPVRQSSKITEPAFTKTEQATGAKNQVSTGPPVYTASNIWQPAPKTSWQWQLSTPVDTSVDAQVYDIDMFENDASVVSNLHTKNHRVICYISAGSIEDWRPDASEFPASVIGKDYVGWPGEKWLDIRRIDILGPIMQKRLDQCKAKGFDGVEPDNINGYSQDTGFPLTYEDQIHYNTWLANEAHKRGLSIGLKQDPDQAGDLVSIYDWALDEECFEFQECDKSRPFIRAGKAVFDAEYNLDANQFCPEANALNINAIRKHQELDVYRESCQ